MQAKESLLKRNYELTQETYSLMEKIEFLEIQNQKLVNQQIEYKKNADSLENDLISQMNNLSLGKEHKQFLIEKDSRILGGETGEILFRFNFKNFNKINTKTIYYYENDGKKTKKRPAKGTLTYSIKNGMTAVDITITELHNHKETLNLEFQCIHHLSKIENLVRSGESNELISLKLINEICKKITPGKAVLCESPLKIKQYIKQYKKEMNTDTEFELLKKDYKLTGNGKKFIRMNLQGDYPMMILCTNSQLLTLTSNQQIYIDGTYLACSNGFQTLFTIMSFDNSTQLFIPAVWALLPDEQTDTLVVLFIYIKNY
ncbi:hypothetical protein M0813_14938 [Anaeramoeba flamelloides]|uniref:Uncharacterized protein n=1 Tax=Anaeramoeba flamelloides TaxID=1746091 RepID=A0ABQ8Z3N9_9EUKA|nr:hypothetical protein M0813_14938 [Anaeramoeba flamelloides]